MNRLSSLRAGAAEQPTEMLDPLALQLSLLDRDFTDAGSSYIHLCAEGYCLTLHFCQGVACASHSAWEKLNHPEHHQEVFLQPDRSFVLRYNVAASTLAA